MSSSPGDGQRPREQVNGLYVHCSPPRVLQVQSGMVRQWLRAGDLQQLERVVLEGQGHKLVGEYSPDGKVRAFLKQIPGFLVRSRRLHDAAAKGDLKQLQKVLSSRRSQEPPMKNIHLSRSQGGLGLLHEAVYHGHPHVVEFLVSTFPESVSMKDNAGRTPLHYCGASKEAGKIWPMLLKAGAALNVADCRGRQPGYYMERSNEIQLPEENSLSGSLLGSAAERNNNIVIKPSNIRIWIHDRDLRKLQQVVWEGHGAKLRVETSKHPKVKRFLDGVPYVLNIIKDVHSSVVSNDLDGFLKKTSPPVPAQVLASKDANGLTPLHKAAGLNRWNIASEILSRNQSLVFVADQGGKTPLHYAAILKDGNAMYSLLTANCADETALDKNGKTPAYYRTSPKEVCTKDLETIPEAPRISSAPQAFDWSLFHSEHTPPTNHFSGKPTPPHHPPAPAPLTTQSPLRPDAEAKPSPSDSKSSVPDLQGAPPPQGHKPSHEPTAGPEATEDFDIWTNDNYGEEGDDRAGGSADEDGGEAREERGFDGRGGEETGVGAEEVSEGLEREEAARGSRELGKAAEEGMEGGRVEEAVGGSREEGMVEGRVEEAVGGSREEGMGEGRVEEAVGGSREEGMREGREEGDKRKSAAGGLAGLGKTEREIAEERQRLLDEGLLKTGLEEEGVDDERKVEEMIEAGDMEKLASMVLNGEGEKLVGKKSSNAEMQSFLENVPVYMAKISGVHEAARSGSLKDLQSVLDRRKFAVAREAGHRAGATPLHEAVVHGRVPIVKYLGRFPETLTSVDDFGRTPLHYAAALADREIYDCLVGLGADPRAEDHEGRTPGFYRDHPGELRREGVEGKDVAVREESLSRGVGTPVTDPSVHDAEAEICFDEGIPLSKSSGNEEADEDSHDDSSQSTFNITDRDEYGQSVLHFAAARAHGRGGLFQLIHESGINLGCRDELYRTARDIAQQANIPENVNEIDKYVISLAAKGETGKLVELFLEGYDHILDLEDDEDNDILAIASNKGLDKTLSFLRAIAGLEEKRERVHRAIRAGDCKSVEAIISESRNGRLLVTGKNGTGRCSLHTAVLCQQKDATEWIAQKYPETLKIGDNLERTALHYAMAVEEVETLSKILIKCGAKRVVKDLKGRQPTYYFMNKTEILKLQEEESALRR